MDQRTSSVIDHFNAVPTSKDHAQIETKEVLDSSVIFPEPFGHAVVYQGTGWRKKRAHTQPRARLPGGARARASSPTAGLAC